MKLSFSNNTFSNLSSVIQKFIVASRKPATFCRDQVQKFSGDRTFVITRILVRVCFIVSNAKPLVTADRLLPWAIACNPICCLWGTEDEMFNTFSSPAIIR